MSVDHVNMGGTDGGVRVSELLSNMGVHSQGLLSIHIYFLTSAITETTLK